LCQLKSLHKEKRNMAQAKTLTPQDIDRVLAYVAGGNYALRNRVILLTGLWSGMRVGELANLRLGDVLTPDGAVKSEIRLAAWQTKGRRPRTVFMPEKLRNELGNYLKLRQNTNPEHPVFVSGFGRAFSPNTLCQHIFWIFREAGIAGASSHSLRRSFITALASRGIGVRVLASLAGHQSISVTQRYIDVNDDMKRRAVELV
jgi:integrase/recombinase XerD